MRRRRISASLGLWSDGARHLFFWGFFGGDSLFPPVSAIGADTHNIIRTETSSHQTGATGKESAKDCTSDAETFFDKLDVGTAALGTAETRRLRFFQNVRVEKSLLFCRWVNSSTFRVLV